MQDRLAQHFLPAEATLLGFTLQPFSLWHWRTLAALGSPLFCGSSADLDLGDLAVAARICALPANSSPAKLQRALRPGPLTRLRLAYFRRFDHFEDVCETWFKYFTHYAAGPIPTDDADGGAASVHPVVYLAAGLMALGYSHAEAWAEQPGLARWMLAGAMEARGDRLAVVSDHMIAEALKAGHTLEEMGLA